MTDLFNKFKSTASGSFIRDVKDGKSFAKAVNSFLNTSDINDFMFNFGEAFPIKHQADIPDECTNSDYSIKAIKKVSDKLVLVFNTKQKMKIPGIGMTFGTTTLEIDIDLRPGTSIEIDSKVLPEQNGTEKHRHFMYVSKGTKKIASLYAFNNYHGELALNALNTLLLGASTKNRTNNNFKFTIM